MSTRQLTFPIRSNQLSMTVAVAETLLDRQSEYQRIEIVRTEAFGKMLLLDGHVQLAELDEHAYHEALVHVPGLSVSHFRRALVVGGGDCGVIRELSKYASVEAIDMVEIDQAVIDASLELLPRLSNGAHLDPRVTIHVEDAFPFVKRDLEPYDLIVMDSTDTYEDEERELSAQLFTSEFYEDCHRLLSPHGFLVTQSDNPLFCPYSLDAVRRTFGQLFTRCGDFWALVPSFGGYSAFCWASKGASIGAGFPFERASGLALRYLSPTTYALGMSRLPFEA